MPYWLWISAGLLAGIGPAVAAGARWARAWFLVSLGLAGVCLVPFGIVLLLFVSDGDTDAIHELAALVVPLLPPAIAWLGASGLMAWFCRGTPQDALPRPQPTDTPPAPVQWMYAGFAITWYALLIVAYIVTLPGHANPIASAFGFFVVIPSISAAYAACRRRRSRPAARLN